MRKRDACLFMPCCFCIKGRDGDEAIISGPMVYKCMRSYWVTDYMSNRSGVYVWGSEVTTQEPMRDNFSNRSRIARAYFCRLLHTVECLSRLVVFVSKIGRWWWWSNDFGSDVFSVFAIILSGWVSLIDRSGVPVRHRFSRRYDSACVPVWKCDRRTS